MSKVVNNSLAICLSATCLCLLLFAFINQSAWPQEKATRQDLLKDLKKAVKKLSANPDSKEQEIVMRQAIEYLEQFKPKQQEKFSLSLEIPIPPDTKIVRAFLDSQAFLPRDFEYSGGQIHLRGPNELLSQLRDGAHHLLVKVRDSVRTYFLEPIIFWKELSSLERYQAKQPKKYAVIVGIGEYKTNDLALDDLPEAPKQAKELGQLLESSGFKVKYFLDTELDHLTKESIDAYLFGKLNHEMNPQEDKLLLYFGGHGLSKSDVFGEKTGYFLPGGYDRANIELTGISMATDVRQRYVPWLRAKHILIAVDACLADVGLRSTPPSQKELKKFIILADLRARTERLGRTILTAGTEGQPAIDKNGGIFTKALIEGLRGGADTNKDGLIDINELDNHVHRQVSGEASMLGLKQTPGRFDIPTNGGEFIHFYRVAGRSEGVEGAQ